MENQVKIFNSPEFGDLRVVGTAEKPLFCVKDLVKVFGTSSSRDLVAFKHVEPDDIVRVDLSGTGLAKKRVNGIISRNIANMIFVTENGLFHLLYGSGRNTKDSVRAYRKWVLSTVRPNMREEKKDSTLSDILAHALQMETEQQCEHQKKVQSLEEECKRLKNEMSEKESRREQATGATASKVEYYDSILKSDGLMTTTMVGQYIGMSAKALNEMLKSIGVLSKRKGECRLNDPYYKWQLGGFDTYVPESNANGGVAHRSFKWNERGLRFIVALSKNYWNTTKAINAINGVG